MRPPGIVLKKEKIDEPVLDKLQTDAEDKYPQTPLEFENEVGFRAFAHAELQKKRLDRKRSSKLKVRKPFGLCAR